MGVQHLPDHVRAHRGDLAWLEKHGEQARRKYVDQHEPAMKEHAALAFDSVMFRNWETGALYGVVPEWLKQQFAAGLSSLEDGFQEILPAGVGWSRALQEEAGSTSGRRAGGAASDREETTVIEPRSVE